MHNQAFFVLVLGLPMVAMADSFYTADITVGNEEIIFNSTEIMVDPNDEVHLDCGMKGHTEPLRACVWTNNGASYQVLDVYQGLYSSKGKPESAEGNQCGIILKEIKHEDHGVWKCEIYITGRSLEDTKTVIVTVKPREVSVPTKVIANIGDDTLVKCKVGRARPPATITWTLNNRDITTEAKEEFLPNVKLIKTTIKVKVNDTEASEKGDREKDTSKDGDKEVEHVINKEVYTGDNTTISTLNHTFTENENHQELKCIINHPTLENPEIHIMPVTVGKFNLTATTMTSSVSEGRFFGIDVGSDQTNFEAGMWLLALVGVLASAIPALFLDPGLGFRRRRAVHQDEDGNGLQDTLKIITKALTRATAIYKRPGKP